MNLWLILARFFGQQLFIRPTRSSWYIITPQATQNLLKQIYSSPSASRRPRRFFKSISWITSSSARQWLAAAVSSVSRKQDFCNNKQNRNYLSYGSPNGINREHRAS